MLTLELILLHYNYPDFQIPAAQCGSISQCKLCQMKEEKLKALRKAIMSGKIKAVQKHYVSLPTEGAHDGHPVGVDGIFCQRVHPFILKISELVSSGVDETKEVQKSTKQLCTLYSSY